MIKYIKVLIINLLQYKEGEREFEIVEEIMEERDETEESENMFVGVEAINEAKNENENKKLKKTKSNVKDEASQEQVYCIR